jgi:hypothetical protein
MSGGSDSGALRTAVAYYSFLPAHATRRVLELNELPAKKVRICGRGHSKRHQMERGNRSCF